MNFEKIFIIYIFSWDIFYTKQCSALTEIHDPWSISPKKIQYRITMTINLFNFFNRAKGDDLERRCEIVNRELRVLSQMNGKIIISCIFQIWYFSFIFFSKNWNFWFFWSFAKCFKLAWVWRPWSTPSRRYFNFSLWKLGIIR